MSIDICVLIGGEAGQGIQTVADLLAIVCHKAGMYIMGINDFESRIRGGHSFTKLRISDTPVSAPHHEVHLLVALNRETFNLHKDDVVDGGKIMVEEKDLDDSENIVHVAMNELAKTAGSKILSNTVAAGSCLALLGAPLDLFASVLKEHFSRKSDTIVEQNIKAAELGFEAVKETVFDWAFEWDPGEKKGAILNGSTAIALGALAGDCRFASFYPMSPATGVMANLSTLMNRFPIVVEQAEDEISAINMVIGASFAGVRSMTSTSGGGFCLMTEGLGLAAMTETPIVIVNAQRPGPATGLPTRTAQGDLLFIVRASQDEFPRFVFSPGTPVEAYEVAARSFYLSEKYQVPVIILTDQYLNDSNFITERPLEVPDKIETFIADDDSLEDSQNYKRFAITPSGVSPRVLPCMGKTLVVASGNEHMEDGHISEDKSNRVSMVDKRNAKLDGMLKEMNPPQTFHEESENQIVCWGSTKGAAIEAMEKLREEGTDIGCIHFIDLWPFPEAFVIPLLEKAKRFFVVECNGSGQFAQLIREQTGLKPAGNVLKYNGRPFFPMDIVNGIRTYI